MAEDVLIFSYPVTIEPRMVDNPFRHLHHADIVRLLEEARLAWLRSIGSSLEDLYQQGLLFVLTQIQVHFQRELFEGEAEVTVENPRFLGKILLLDQTIFRPQTPRSFPAVTSAQADPEGVGKWKEAVRAQVGQCLISRLSRRAEAPSDELKARLLGNS